MRSRLSRYGAVSKLRGLFDPRLGAVVSAAAAPTIDREHVAEAIIATVQHQLQEDGSSFS